VNFRGDPADTLCMSDPDVARRAREWLERQLAELGQLRNASRRDPSFKAWRQQTLTVIQRIWPGEVTRMDRFRRIPFSPPTVQSTDRQMREYFERGWGEAGVVLRGYLAEIDRLGLSGALLPESAAPAAEPEIASRSAPEPEEQAVGDHQVAPWLDEKETGRENVARDEISRAMDRLLTNSPVFRGGAAAITRRAEIPSASKPAEASASKPADVPASKPADVLAYRPRESPVADLLGVASELESLGLSPARTAAAREALLQLARSAGGPAPDWALVREAIAQAAATPALARRLLPLLLPFVDRAA